MSLTPHHIVVLDGLPANPGDLSWSPLEVLGRLTVHPRTAPAETPDRVRDATAIVTNKVRIGAAELDAAPNCRIVCSLATGFDHVDVAAARARGVRVTNVPAYSTATTAQLTFALILALAHRVEAHDLDVRRGGWSAAPTFSYWTSPQRELDSKNLLVVGGGAIGTRVGAIGEALGMRVAFAGLPSRPARPDRMPWSDALSWADVVTLNVPLAPTTRHLVDAEALGRMKPGAWLVNVARGAVVDELAVANALAAGSLGAYATDVLSSEPPPADHVLLSAPNCLVTPHIGWVSVEARARLIAETARSIAALDAGESVNVVG